MRAHLDGLSTQEAFQVGNGDHASMKHAGGEGAVDPCVLKYLGKVLWSPGAAGGDQRHPAALAHCRELGNVIALQFRTISPAPRSCTSCTQSSVRRVVLRVRCGSPVN